MARIQGMALNRNNRGLLILAIAAGLVTAVLVFVALANNGSDSGKTSTAAVTSKALVAQKAIPAGTEITAGMVKIIDIPDDLLLPGAFADSAPAVGQVTKVAIAANEQVTLAKIGPLVQGVGLSYVVPKGKRGVGLKVEEVTAVGGLLLPGDRVDVVAAFKVKGVPGVPEGYHIESVRTILQNVEVL